MPFTLNGIGTSFYGKRDFRPDGSYITTTWFVLVFLPIFPIRSQRVAATGNSKNYIIYATSSYAILERTGINMQQVLSVYGWFAALISCSWLIELSGSWLAIFPTLATIFAPWFLRRRAIQRMHEEFQRAQMGLGTQQ